MTPAPPRRLLRRAPALLALLAAAAAAAAPIDDWRAEAARVRILAENDVPRAYDEARRLQAALPADATPADRARALNLRARAETYLGLTDDAARHADQAFALAKEHADRIGQAEADLNVSLNSMNQGRLDEHVRANTDSVTVLEGVNDRPELLAEALLRTATMYRRFEQFEESVAVAVQGMEIARRSGSPLALAYAHQGLALAYDQSYRANEARDHYNQMRAQAKVVPSRLMEAFAVAGLGGVEANLGNLAAGERLIREALTIARAAGANFAHAFILFGLSSNLRLQGRHAEALVLINESLALFERYPNRIGRWFALNARSEIKQAQGEVAAARADAESAYVVAKELNLALYTSGSALRMASIAAAAGEHKRAYDFAVEARELTTRAAREKAAVRMMQLVKRYESESKQRQIDELTRRTERQAAELRQRELQQGWLATVLVGSGGVIAVTAYFLLRLRRSYHQLGALNVELERSRDAVRALNAGLEQRVQARTAELRQQARYLRTLIDMLPMWAWFKDTHSRYLVTNQSYAQARGHTPDDMVGRSDVELLPPPQAEATLADDARVMAQRERRTTEEAVPASAGSVWMETYKAPVLDEDGTMLGTVGVARDISDRRSTEAAREAALDEARHLARTRSAFLAQMSHELRTPLNAILGFAQLLQGSGPLTESQARGLAIIEQSGEHLLALINDVLDLSRIDAGRLDLSPADVDLATFLQVVGDIVRVKADEKGLAFVVELPQDLPETVRVDEMRLRQVLLNLLSNAVKFTDRGQVRLSVWPVSAPAEQCQPGVVRLRFEVEDSGIGMGPEQLARIFQPFEQVADAGRRTGGAGLGLAISRQLVRLMGGDILVRSAPGQGSAFWFDLDLPVVSESLAAERRGRVVGVEGPRRRLLVVDDVPSIRALLCDMLRQVGFEVRDAADGRAGVEAALAFRPDLVLMDMTMPVMDGLEATRRLRATPELQAVPVLAMSASALADAEARCRAAGANAFIGKPIDAEPLFALIGDLLQLTWIREASPSPDMPLAAAPPTSQADLVVPPQDELRVLQRLAKIGRMPALSARADHLQALDERYAAFASRLRELARGYQSQAIAALVDQYVDAPDDADGAATRPADADGAATRPADAGGAATRPVDAGGMSPPPGGAG